MTEEVTHIPFKQLEISPLNVRTVDPSKAKDKELLASIRARGILQNLIVLPIEKNRFGVCAGGRRFAAATLLHEEGAISGDTLVPCRVAADDQQARDWSMAENSGREGMHPADEFMAYHALAKAGKTISDIARENGVSKNHVKRLLKLATVAPALIEEFRAGKLDLDEIQAFSVTEDQEKQITVYKQLQQYIRSPSRIRQALVGEAYRSDDRLAKFVGVAAYKSAGGAVSSDLFESVSYLSDSELLEKLAMEKLQAEAKQYEAQGWKWVRVDLEQTYLPYGAFPRTLSPAPDTAPAGLRERLEVKAAELKALEDSDAEELSDQDHERYDTLCDEVEALEAEVEENSEFLDSDKALSGVVLLVNFQGKPEAHCGLMSREDIADRRKDSESGAGENGGEAGGVGEESPYVESAALKFDLDNFKLQAMQAEMLKHPALASDLLIFTLAESLEITDIHVWSTPLGVSARQESLSQTPGIEGTTAAEQLSVHHQKLDTSWADHEAREARFLEFKSLTPKKKQAILTHCVALLLGKGMGGIEETVAEEMGFNMLDYWQPTADNYFNRIKSGDLKDIARKQLGDSWCSEHSKLKKGELAQALAEDEGIEGWLPDYLK